MWNVRAVSGNLLQRGVPSIPAVLCQSAVQIADDGHDESCQPEVLSEKYIQTRFHQTG